jgi:hypothetical protein
MAGPVNLFRLPLSIAHGAGCPLPNRASVDRRLPSASSFFARDATLRKAGPLLPRQQRQFEECYRSR